MTIRMYCFWSDCFILIGRGSRYVIYDFVLMDSDVKIL